MFHTLAVFSLLAVAAQAAVPHFARQTDCTTPCTTLSNALSAAGTSAEGSTGTAALASLCTSTIMNDYGACYGCEVQINATPQADAQQVIDDFASGCQADGHPVASVTINADGSTSGGGASPAASGSSSSASAPAGKKSGAVRASTSLAGVAYLGVCIQYPLHKVEMWWQEILRIYVAFPLPRGLRASHKQRGHDEKQGYGCNAGEVLGACINRSEPREGEKFAAARLYQKVLSTTQSSAADGWRMIKMDKDLQPDIEIVSLGPARLQGLQNRVKPY
ncbi:hypothetical protein B0H11DRAFT_1926991 [Mycena galericulata]|nr:hypothetical protein B0H11DRAFT_1926991 [Mycena galericulata]